MDTVTIRQAIQAAKLHEKKTGQLAGQLARRANQLHHSIELPSRHIVPVLLNFILHYTDHLPEFMDAVDAITYDSGVSDYFDPILTTIEEFFVHPPEPLRGYDGLFASMTQTYLAHRLIEEINDRFISFCGSTLLPMDMTRSNLIIHHLIGEPLANQLDEILQLIADHLEQHAHLLSGSSILRYHRATRNWQWSEYLHRWPCLVDTLSLDIALNFGSHKIILH